MSESLLDHESYRVVLNDEEMYSIWPSTFPNALGWKDDGYIGTKAECLLYIKEKWIDMRPKTLRELERK
jgi:MbtH protein